MGDASPKRLPNEVDSQHSPSCSNLAPIIGRGRGVEPWALRRTPRARKRGSARRAHLGRRYERAQDRVDGALGQGPHLAGYFGRERAIDELAELLFQTR